MSLFVGNISKYVKSWELEDEFMRFGRCEIKRNVSNVSVSSLTYINQSRDQSVHYLSSPFLIKFICISSNAIEMEDFVSEFIIFFPEQCGSMEPYSWPPASTSWDCMVGSCVLHQLD